MKELQLRKYFWILLGLLILTLVVNLIFFVMPAIGKLGNSFQPARTISVNAEGKVTAVPDMAVVDFSVVTQGKSPNDLANENNQKMSATIDNLKSSGVADQDIKTISYNLSPDYQYDKNSNRNFIIGYTLTQSIEVKIRDLNKAADIIGGVTPLGVNQIGGVSFTISDEKEKELLAEARKKAVANALGKAGELASQSGMSVGKPVSLQEYSVLPVIYNAAVAQKYAASGMAAPEPSIQPGSEDITVNVSAVYELKNN